MTLEPVSKYTHIQAMPMPEWIVHHGLNAHVIVRAFDLDGNPLDEWPWFMSVVHEDLNTTILRFRQAESVYTPAAGKAVIIG